MQVKNKKKCVQIPDDLGLYYATYLQKRLWKEVPEKGMGPKTEVGDIPMPGRWSAVPWCPIRTWLAGSDSESWPGLKVEAY